MIVESGDKKGLMKGLSRNYLDLRFPGDQLLVGQCVKVKPIAWDDYFLRAERVWSA